MPVPQGDITTSEILNTPAVDKKKYKVQLIVKRRVRVFVEAENEDDACMVAQDIYATGDSNKYDEFLLGPDAEVEEITE
jgi:hypothetical protein